MSNNVDHDDIISFILQEAASVVDAGESARQSRAALSKANSVPEWLLTKYARWCITQCTRTPLYHCSRESYVVDRSMTARASDFRLTQHNVSGSGCDFSRAPSHILRNSCSASYNGALDQTTVDESKWQTRQLPPMERSMGQAFFMVYSWLRKAKEPVAPKAAKRKRESSS